MSRAYRRNAKKPNGNYENRSLLEPLGDSRIDIGHCKPPQYRMIPKCGYIQRLGQSQDLYALTCHRGATDLSPWIDENGRKDASSPSNLFVYLRLNLIVITIDWLIFSLVVTAIWIALHESGALVISSFDGTVHTTLFGFLIFFITAKFGGALSKRAENGTAFISLISATNNLMSDMRSVVEEEFQAWKANNELSFIYKTDGRSGKQWGRKPKAPIQVLREMYLICNAILFGQRNALRTEIDATLLPLPNDLIDEVLAGDEDMDELVTMQVMLKTRIDLLKKSGLVTLSEESTLFKFHKEGIDNLGNLDVGSKTVPAKVVAFTTNLLLILFTIALPPFFITLYPGYLALAAVPGVMLILYALSRIADKVPNIFVSRKDNIWSGFPLLDYVYSGSALNRKAYDQIVEIIKDVD